MNIHKTTTVIITQVSSFKQWVYEITLQIIIFCLQTPFSYTAVITSFLNPVYITIVLAD